MVLVILDNGYLVGTDGAGAFEGSFVVRCLLYLRVFLSCRRSCLFNIQEFEFVDQVRIERGVCLVRQYLPLQVKERVPGTSTSLFRYKYQNQVLVSSSLPLQALDNVNPVLEQNPRHPLALHVKVDVGHVEPWCCCP